MKTVTVYGIKNCDTMKKAFVWLDKRGVDYVFHDYKKSGADAAVLKRAVEAEGWENVINRKGTTWRALPADVREKMTAARAIRAAMENPSLVRRPLVVAGRRIMLGFDADAYEKAFPKA